MIITLQDQPYRIYPETGYISVTTYTDEFPKGKGYDTYLLNNTPESAAQTLKRAGERGTRVHDTIEQILNGTEVTYEWYKENMCYGREWQALDEYGCIEAFYNWYEDFGRPKPLAAEIKCHSHKLKFSGTIDSIFEIKGRKVIVDWKTSNTVTETIAIDGKQKEILQISKAMQQAAYWHAAEEDGDIKIDNCAIVHLGSGHRTSSVLKDLEKPHSGVGYKYWPVLGSERPFLMKNMKWCIEQFHRKYGHDLVPKTKEVRDSIKIDNFIKS